MAGLLPNNPFSQWVDPRRNALMGFSAGMLSGDPGAAMRYAMQGSGIDREMALQAQQQAQAEAERNATLEWVKQNAPQFATLPPAMAFEAAMKQLQQAQGGSNEFQERFQAGQQYGLTGDELNTFALTGSVPGTARSNVTYGTTPVWGKDASGKVGYGVTGSDGTFKLVETPGFQPLGPYDVNAEKAAGTAFGKETGAAQFELPVMAKELEQSLNSIKKLSEPDIAAGKDDWFKQAGALPRGMWVQGGTNMAKFQVAANNLIDRSWLSARAMLKGGGPITDYESNKAENAVSMMKGALDKGDKKTYDDAVIEYEYWIKQGFAKLQQQAGTMAGYGGAPAGAGPVASGNGWTVLGVE